ncbi:cytochrome c [SAR202 cluster bacterium AD-812-D07_MRT_10900m]|nr:cytochrome c [SAR202 cluster bacterium AD-812-D07_MRT_10900m]
MANTRRPTCREAVISPRACSWFRPAGHRPTFRLGHKVVSVTIDDRPQEVRSRIDLPLEDRAPKIAGFPGQFRTPEDECTGSSSTSPSPGPWSSVSPTTLQPGDERRTLSLARQAAVGSEFDQALADQGKTLYEGNFCSGCHSRGSDRIVGPGHQNVYETAKTRVPGMSPEDYLRQSIPDPGAFVVPGFPAIMPSFDSLDDNQILALIEYLKSL